MKVLIPIAVVCNCLLQLTVVIVSILLLIKQGKLAGASDKDVAVVTELNDDWAVVPFVSMRVSDTECEADEEAVFVREWGGTVFGCVYEEKNSVFGKATTTVLGTSEEYNDYIDSISSVKTRGMAKRNYPCSGVPTKSAVQ